MSGAALCADSADSADSADKTHGFSDRNQRQSPPVSLRLTIAISYFTHFLCSICTAYRNPLKNNGKFSADKRADDSADGQRNIGQFGPRRRHLHTLKEQNDGICTRVQHGFGAA